MLDFNTFLSIDKLAVIGANLRISEVGAMSLARRRTFVLGVNKTTLVSTYGTIYAYDTVTGRCIIQGVNAAQVEAYDEAFNIPDKLAPNVLYWKEDKWVTGKLHGLGDVAETFQVVDSETDLFLTVPAKDVCFPAQAATYARAWGMPGLSGGPNKNPDAVDKAASAPSDQAEAAR